LEVNLQAVLEGRQADVVLQREDVIRISSIYDVQNERYIQILGEVKRPGTYPYAAGMTPEELILTAGGLQESANIKDIEIASGCFMFFRKQALVFVKGFDQKYFLYFEDFDLCLRLRKQWKIAYLPNVKISHFGGNASRKGWRHTVFFIESALFFFKNHGLYY
jgi:GT2 family glycosyltransferase